MELLLDTERAAAELEKMGVRRSPKTLRKLRSVGGGPKFRILNHKPYYTEADLIAWIEERLSPPRRNTSERTTLAATSPATAPTATRPRPEASAAG
jgi:hypothetical protein